MTTFGKLIRNDTLRKINETPIDCFYSTPTPEEVEETFKQAAAYQADKKIISPKTRER